ncbi:MAG: Fur family transcriptional regulator [Sphingomonadaceae bacterium]
MCTSTGFDQWHGFGLPEREMVAAALAERGLRLTPQREAVCEAVFGCPGHICAEHILEKVSAHHPDLKVNKTTVYRTLDLLLELGLITEHKCGDERAQYEPASRGRHSHLLCRRCGELLDLDDGVAVTLQAGLRALHGFQADLESYPIFGLCSACRSS